MENSPIRWLFVLASFMLHFVVTCSVLGGNETDRLSLLAFKAEISHDPHPALASWNNSLHFCHWLGVTCGKKHRRVTGLDLRSLQLSGTLSPHVGNLSFLRRLILPSNNIGGHIPLEVGRLFRLQTLVLVNNSFSGEIPRNISGCSNLLFLSLDSNTLTGRIPTELSSLSKLRQLTLTNNSLVGQILPSLGNLSSLEEFGIQENHFQGSIPDSFGLLKGLTTFLAGVNNLSGQIPPSIFNLSSIKHISVLVNQLQGSLPPDLGHRLPDIEILTLDTNLFHGPIPPSISNASKLWKLSLGDNQFTGTVPLLANLNDLRFVVLEFNKLTDYEDMNFLSPLLNCSNLESLALSYNDFGGVLPEYISNFSTKLKVLAFGSNHIRGNIPREIGNLINLQDVEMERNQLTGTIPSSIGKLKKLHLLFLNRNQLSGGIPSSIGNMSMLEKLYLRLNNLEGSIPKSIGQCQNLIWLYLSGNNLNGMIPKEVFSISSLTYAFDLSGNHFTGSLPMEVGKLVNLNYLNVSNNNLTGEIPVALSKCVGLDILSLKGNLFQGTIPQSLSSLKGIRILDLSQNDLSGQIPKYFETLRFLEYLNLSSNNFEGELSTEGVFRNASKFSVTGNSKLCGGIPELKLLRCKSNEPKKKLSHKLKLFTITFGGILGALSILSCIALFWLRKTKDERVLSSSLQHSHLRVSYYDLFKATNGFAASNLIGSGGFGSVYKGILTQDETVVAVKVFNLQYKASFKSFMAECEALRNIRHRNLVRSLTACSSIDSQGNDFLALVYEFMENGSLEDWLYPTERSNERYLNFMQRLNISIEVAGALDYLHNQCHIKIVHCDLKPSNILLDGDMTAHVGDFGLARFIHEASRHSSSENTSSIGLKGSIGYAAPEYGIGGEISNHGDMYSYGILLLEMFTGKRPTDVMFKDEFDLHNFALMGLQEGISSVVDPIILQQIEEETGNYNTRQTHKHLVSIIEIGLACSAKHPRERKDIGHAAAELSLIRRSYLGNRT